MWWSVSLAFDDPNGDRSVDTDEVGDLVAALAEFSASGGGHGRRYDVTVSVEEPEARAAADAAVQAVRAAADDLGLPRWPLVRLEVLTEEELDAELAKPSLPELAGADEAAAILDVGVDRVRALAAQSRLPLPLVELAATPLWDAHALRAVAEHH